ncbi:PA3496 family putative envelope integrity protein [Nitrincola sp.]|uniref:PA3496 family putative envelope integrity protein n=1 Tax=Nitrincola sp. TaxID=1926584 RepID=UPI003A8FCD18
MLIRQEQDLDPIQTEVFDLLVGYDVEEKNRRKQTATRRLFEARRAIEKRREEAALAAFIDRERWFDDE